MDNRSSTAQPRFGTDVERRAAIAENEPEDLEARRTPTKGREERTSARTTCGCAGPRCSARPRPPPLPRIARPHDRLAHPREVLRRARQGPCEPLIAIAGGGGVNLFNSEGSAWTADYLKITGELDVDLRSSIAAEARAKIVYERLASHQFLPRCRHKGCASIPHDTGNHSYAGIFDCARKHGQAPLQHRPHSPNAETRRSVLQRFDRRRSQLILRNAVARLYPIIRA